MLLLTTWVCVGYHSGFLWRSHGSGSFKCRRHRVQVHVSGDSLGSTSESAERALTQLVSFKNLRNLVCQRPSLPPTNCKLCNGFITTFQVPKSTENFRTTLQRLKKVGNNFHLHVWQYSAWCWRWSLTMKHMSGFRKMCCSIASCSMWLELNQDGHKEVVTTVNVLVHVQVQLWCTPEIWKQHVELLHFSPVTIDRLQHADRHDLEDLGYRGHSQN